MTNGALVSRRVGGGGVQGFFFSGCSGVIRGYPYLVGALGGVRICSDLFRFVRGVPEWGAGMAGVDGGKFLATLVNFCQPGVKLCQVLVSVGETGVAGVRCASAGLRGERHDPALLFWCERSRSWGDWRWAVGDSWGRYS